MGLHPHDQSGPRRAPQEIFDLAVDEKEMLFQAMALLKLIEKENLTKNRKAIPVKAIVPLSRLKQAFEIYKENY